MPVETQYEAKTLPRVQIWAAYNHLPGGQIVAVHFEDMVRMKKVGDSQTNFLFTAKEQLEAFEKGDQICINIKGQITKHKVLTFQGPDISYNPKAADVVIAWAQEKGLWPVESKNDKGAKGYESDKRLAQVEVDVASLKGSVGALTSAVDKLVEVLTPKK